MIITDNATKYAAWLKIPVKTLPKMFKNAIKNKLSVFDFRDVKTQATATAMVESIKKQHGCHSVSIFAGLMYAHTGETLYAVYKVPPEWRLKTYRGKA